MGLRIFLYVVIGILICFILCIRCNRDSSTPLIIKSTERMQPRDVSEEGSPIWKIRFENGDSCYRTNNESIGDTIWVHKN